MNCRLPVFLVVCSTLVLGACSARKPSATLTGTVTYSETVDFHNKAQLQVLLTDVSAQGNSPEIASSTMDIAQLPVAYVLPYEADKIIPDHRYTVSARIRVDGALHYATDTAIEVLTQGKTNHADFMVALAGNSVNGVTTTAPVGETFSGNITHGSDIALYRAGIADGHIAWLEEDRSNGTPTPAHNSYKFKGALLTYYSDTTPLEIQFDDTGKPKSVTRNGKSADVKVEMNAINAVRNRAALLRADALSKRESQAHRKATKNDIG
ncbi:MAG: YbaY family lipoprotein [Steroidobacter sp.]